MARWTCDGSHECDPPSFPGEGDTWTCDECGKAFRAFPVNSATVPLSKMAAEALPPNHWGWTTRPIEETCHCGRWVYFGFDGDPTHHRGMCAGCDSARCDAYPQDCPYPATT